VVIFRAWRPCKFGVQFKVYVVLRLGGSRETWASGSGKAGPGLRPPAILTRCVNVSRSVKYRSARKANWLPGFLIERLSPGVRRLHH
jgi:hypothetical protein